ISTTVPQLHERFVYISHLYRKPLAFTEKCDQNNFDWRYMRTKNCTDLCVTLRMNDKVGGRRRFGFMRGCMSDIVHYNRSVIRGSMDSDVCYLVRLRDLFVTSERYSFDSADHVEMCTCQKTMCNAATSTSAGLLGNLLPLTLALSSFAYLRGSSIDFDLSAHLRYRQLTMDLWRRLLVALVLLLSVAAINRIMEQKAWGPEIVDSCVRKIQRSCIFDNDYDFLRRVAFQETRDGRVLVSQWSNNKSLGGIWQVDGPSLANLKSANYGVFLRMKDEVAATFNVSIDSLDFGTGDLQVPLQGSIAASGKILALQQPVPMTLEAQAKYWANYYTTNNHARPEDFVNNLANLPNCSNRGVDLVFVIDSSTSIGNDTFQDVRNFIKRVVGEMDIGENATQVGIIDFSDVVNVVLSLSSSEDSVLNAVDSLSYLSENTASALALHAATSNFAEHARDQSEGYPRVAVLITDGAPDNTSAAIAAANRLKASGVTLFTVAVTDYITNDTNLLEMASTPKCLHFYKLTDCKQLALEFPEVIVRRTCQLTTTVASNVESISTQIASKQDLYLKVPVNATTGTTLRLSASEGIASLYVSLTEQQPSAAIYDYTTVGFAGSVDGQIFVSPKDLDSSKEVSTSEDEEPAVFVYASVSGIFDSNTFTLSFDSGDTTAPQHGHAAANAKYSFYARCVLPLIFIIF
ncbi:Collagen alpha-4(VI) chain, partial [Aphelenchoides avenae]